MEDLILAVLSGEATHQEQRALYRWRNESPENERVYQEYARTWQVLPLHASQEPVPAPPPLEQLTAAGDLRRRQAVPLKPPVKRRIGTWLWATAALVAGIVAVAVPALRTHPPDLTVATGPGEARTIPLMDGSVVRLGPHSSLEYWSGSERRAEFSGTGFFAIASDSTSPFRVHSAAGVVEVLGTRFEVRSVGDSLQLVVVEGAVALSAVGHQVELSKGEMAAIGSGAPPSAPQRVNVWEMLNWQDGLLIFQDTPMADVVAEVERYFGVPIAISDSTLARRLVTAWFDQAPFEEVLGTICQVVGARCLLGENVEITP